MLRDRSAIAGMFFGNGFIIGVWATQIPGLLTRFDISKSVLGLLILALGLGAAGIMPFAGRMIPRHGAGPVAAWFAFPVTLCLPLIYFAPNLAVLAVSIVLLGLFNGGMDVSMNSTAVAVEQKHGKAIMSQSHGFWSLGGFVGGGLGAYLTVNFGIGIATLGAFLVTCLSILPAAIYLARRYNKTDEAPKNGQKSRLFPRDLAVWVLGFMALFAMVPEGAILDWAAIYMAQELGADSLTAGISFALFSGSMAIMRFAGDFIRMKMGAVRALRWSALAGAAGIGVASIAPHPWLALLGFSIAGLGIANLVPVLFSAAGNLPNLPSGQAMSVVTMIGYSGLLAAPGLIGFAAEIFGLSMTYAALSLMLLVVAALAERSKAADQPARRS